MEEHLKHVQGAVPMVLMPPIVQKLELGDIERQVDFGDTAIGADHLSQPRPGTLDGVAMDLTLAISVQVQGILTAPVIDRLVPIPLAGEEVIDAVAVGIDAGAPLDHLFHDGANGFCLNIAQHKQTDLTPPTDETKDVQRIFIVLRASITLYFTRN